MGRAGLVAFLVFACRESGSVPTEQRATPSSSASAPASIAADADTRSRDVRALVQRRDAGAVEALLGALADESPEVMRFAAFGLGLGASGRERELTAALALRAASLLAEPDPARARRIIPDIADALSRAATVEAERTLRSLLELEPPIAEAAAEALGRLAGKRGTLEEVTVVALLDRARDTRAPLESALYALSRVPPPEPLVERVLAAATRALHGAELERRFAVRVLGRLGFGAEKALEQAFEGALSPLERAEIVRELAHTGEGGKAVLARLLVVLASRALTRDLGEESGETEVLLVILEALGESSPETRPVLERLARITLPETERERARAIELRCQAARLLAVDLERHAELRACDPDPEGRAGKLALLAVLDRGKLLGARASTYHELLADEDPLLRQAAIRIVQNHRELQMGTEPFVKALKNDAPGVIVAAAEVLTHEPQRANAQSTGQPSVDPALIGALGSALDAAEKAYNVAVHAALIDLAGVFSGHNLESALERACRSPNATLREHAERALAGSGSSQRCADEGSREPPSPSVPRVVAKHLVFETEVGELRISLEPELAPLAAARLTELATSGFYAGTRVHRSLPGFLVQLGDPGGDGYGGAALPPLPTELAPSRFEPFSVGIVTSGRDSGSSQFFVTLGRFPHLDGEYTRVGHAGPGWEKLRVGDRVLGVRLE